MRTTTLQRASAAAARRLQRRGHPHRPRLPSAPVHALRVHGPARLATWPATPGGYHATLLHLFGLDHQRLVYARNNQELTLTDNQSARVVGEVIRGYPGLG